MNKIKNIYWLHSIPFFEYHHRKALWRNYKRLPKLKNLPKPIIDIISFFDIKYTWYKVKKQYKGLLENTNKFIVLCPEYVEEINKVFDYKYENKLSYLWNTLTINENPKLEKKNIIIYTGRLYLLDKQVDRLIDIWNKVESLLKDWELHIYGDGFMEDELKSKIKNLNLSRIKLLGHRHNLQHVYDEASISLLTSNYEGWPMSLIEAQNNAVIPISFASSNGIVSIIGEKNKAGILIEPYDIDKFAKELVSLCNNPDKIKELQSACLEKRKDYTFQSNIPLLANIFGDNNGIHKKIAVIRPYFAIGGVESVFYELARQLKSKNIEFVVFTSAIYQNLNDIGLSDLEIYKVPLMEDLIDGRYPNVSMFWSDENMNFVKEKISDLGIDKLVYLWHLDKLPKL